MRRLRKNMTIFLVFAMVLQIVAPTASNFVFAAADEAFKVVDIDIEGSEATVYWTFDYVAGEEVNSPIQLDFTLVEEEEGELFDVAAQINIGNYEITKDGEMVVTISEKLEDEVRELLRKKLESGEIIIQSKDTEQSVPEVVYGPEGPGLVEYSFSGSFDIEGIIERLPFTGLDASREAGVDGDLGNIFSNPVLGVNKDKSNVNEDDELIFDPVSDGDIIEIEEGISYQLKFDWELIDSGAKAGDWATIQIPNIFGDINIAGLDIMVDDENDVKVKVGKYSIKDYELKFIFDENIQDSDVKKGYVGFRIDFSLEKFEEDIEQIIEFEDKDETTLDVILKPSNLGESIYKLGLPDGKANLEENYDVREIVWIIDVINTSEEAIANSSVNDIMPDGLVFKEGSAKIKELSLDYKGDRVVDELSSKPIVPEEEGKELKFDLGGISSYKGYRIEYTTTITGLDFKSFTNKAIFTYDGENSLPAEATVGGIIRSNPIEKEGKHIENTDIIEWTIDINKSGGEFENAIVGDNYEEYPYYKLFKDASSGKYIEVYKLAKSGSDWIATRVQGMDSDIFPIELGSLTKDDAYRIKFKTEIDYSQVNNGIYEEKNEFTNTATLKDGEVEKGSATAEVITVNRNAILRKEGHSKVDYKNKTIEWTIHVNEANHPTTGNVVVKDILPKGLSITKNDIKVYYDKDSNNEVEKTGYNVTIEEGFNEKGGKTVTINLGEVGREYRKIVYTTKIDDLSIAEFDNTASLSGGGIGKGDEGIDNPGPVTPKPNDFAKEHVKTDYAKKEMEWLITMDPIKEDITKLKITDTFPNKGMILLPDEDFVVKKENMDEPLERGTQYTLSPNSVGSEGEEGYDRGYHLGFILEFTGDSLPLNAKTTIEYKTSFDPQKEVGGDYLEENKDETRKYINKALFEWETATGKKDPVEKEASTTLIKEAWDSGKKLGKLVSKDSSGKIVNDWISGNTRQIEWELYINYLGQNLDEGVVVTDTLSYEGKIISDSIEVEEYEVLESGDAYPIAGTALTKVEDYTVELTQGGKGFELEFNGEVKARYVIRFRTTVPDLSAQTYVNTADVIKKDGTKYPYTGSVNFGNYEEHLSKKSDVSGKVYTDTEINWDIVINESLSVISEAKIVDMISPGLVYVDDTLSISRLEGDDRVPLEKDKDYSLDVSPSTELGTVLTIEFTKKIDAAHVLEYTTVVTAKSGQVNNKVVFSGNGKEIKSVETSKINADLFSFVGGVRDPNKGQILIEKLRAGTNDKIEKLSAKFEIYYLLNGKLHQFGEAYSTVEGVLDIYNIPLRTYYLREIEAPEGYEFTPIEDEDGNLPNPDDWPVKWIVELNGTTKKIELKVENTKKLINITGTKVWVNGPEEKPEIQLQLKQNNELYGDAVTLTGIEDGWAYTWEGLDEYDEDGKLYIYTVEEPGVPEIYDSVVTKSDDGFLVTNIYISPKISVTVNKEWIGGESVRPDSIEVQLLRNGEDYGTPISLNDESWTHTWTDLDKTDEYGKEYNYDVIELKIEGYEPSYGDAEIVDGGLSFTITNNYKSKVTDIVGRKIWGGGPKPSIELQLYRQIKNGEKQAVGGLVTLEEGENIYIWKNQEVTDESGNEYIYTIDEVNVPENYTKTISENGLIITNTYTSPKTSVTGKKVWIGGPNRKPIIELQLYRDKVAVGDPVRLENGETEHTWDDLDKTDANGKEYVYTVDEVRVPNGYRKSISEDGLTVTNTYRPTDPGGGGGGPEEPPRPIDPVDPPKPTDPVDPEEPPVEEETPPDTPIEIEVPKGGVPKVKNPPENGTVTVDEDGNWTYTPNPGFEGKDKFSITITHPDGTEEEIFFEIDITPPLGGVEVQGEPKEEVPTLPKTGQMDSIVFYVLGLFVLFIGIVLRKKTA